jgi:hypothetical protein
MYIHVEEAFLRKKFKKSPAFSFSVFHEEGEEHKKWWLCPPVLPISSLPTVGG